MYHRRQLLVAIGAALTHTTYSKPLVPSKKEILRGRLTAQIEGDFVVVLIGSAFTSWRSIPQALSTAMSMRQMLKELQDEPYAGFLGATSWLSNPSVSIQYWRSLEDLHRYARTPKRKHVGAWGRFNRYLKEAAAGQHSDKGMGIYHEAYQVHAGEYETVYSNVPPTGLGQFTQLVPIQDKRSTKPSKQRLPAQGPGALDPMACLEASSADQTPVS
ncbi:hypothetical protein WJX84_007756 [Apatococcus fuscideae]|uniref:DUF4188 domain-containing protein n=1 Tax=Apatococcus fuscideae TaxID=2026836 RepID=A0AAW1T9X3_9CHLO